MKYILDENQKPQLEPNILKWGSWFETANRQVARHSFKFRKVHVSTIFLGLDHRHFGFHPENPPVLWETMIFGGQHDNYQDRYTSAEAALQGHLTALLLLTVRRGCSTRASKVFRKRIWKILERYTR